MGRKRKFTDEEDQWIAEYAASEALTQREIGKRMGCAASTVNRTLSRLREQSTALSCIPVANGSQEPEAPTEYCISKPVSKETFQCGDRAQIAICRCGVTHYFEDEEEIAKWMKAATKDDTGCPLCGATHMYICDGFSTLQGHGLYHRIGLKVYSEACEYGSKGSAVDLSHIVL